MNIDESITKKVSECKIFKKPEGWIIEYPQFARLADEQMHTFWPWDEPEVENDIQDLRVKMSPAENHAITENLKLFTLYEMHVGDDYWSGRVMKKFKRPELQRGASMFSAVEFNSHAPFYNRVNELLFIDTEDFYSEWKQSDSLRKRMAFIGKYASSENDLISSAAFSFIEGVILYSSFAFFKHFQAQECGKDLIKNVCRGINLSVADENTHAVFGAMLYHTMFNEVKDKLTSEELKYIKSTVYGLAKTTYEHEDIIIERLFLKGEIGGITKANMKDFIKHRINLGLEQLGFEPLYNEDELDGFIKSWFYKDINTVAFHDFFSGNGSEYNINWKEDRFGNVWNKGDK